MNQGKYVFAQIMDYVSAYELSKCIKRYNGDYRIRKLSSVQQCKALIFGQLSHRESLRDIVTCLKAHADKMYHLGFHSLPARNTLSVANKKRDWRIFRDFALYLIDQVRPMELESKEIRDLNLAGTIYILDSTIINLCLGLYGWAKFDSTQSVIKLNVQLDLDGSIPAFFTITKGISSDVEFLDKVIYEKDAYYIMDKGYLDYKRWHTIHMSKAYFVTRARINMGIRRVYSNKSDKSKGVLCDQTAVLTDPKSYERYPNKMRRIKYKDFETNITYTFITNDMTSPATTIALLYKHRWQIELLFKWMKQHLHIKRFWGVSANTVKTQICVAICAYLIMALIKKRLDIKLDLYKILQITSVSLFDKKPLKLLYSQDLLHSDEGDKQNQLTLQGF